MTVRIPASAMPGSSPSGTPSVLSGRGSFAIFSTRLRSRKDKVIGSWSARSRAVGLSARWASTDCPAMTMRRSVTGASCVVGWPDVVDDSDPAVDGAVVATLEQAAIRSTCPQSGTGGHSLPSGRVAQRSSPRQLPCGGAPKPQAHNERRTRDSPPRSLPLRLILWSSRVSALGAHVRAVTAHTVGAAREMMLTTTSTGHLCSPANRGPISHRACECCALPDGSHWAPARR